MSTSRLWNANVKFMRVTLTPQDAEAIAEDAMDWQDSLINLCKFAEEHWIQFKIRVDLNDHRWVAAFYVDDKSHMWHGCLLQSKAPTLAAAVTALSYKLKLIGDRDWLNFVDTGRGGATTIE